MTPEQIVSLLRQRHLTFAAAESCTGGMIAGRITDVPGSSEIFLGGVVSYSNELKQKILHVSPETLASFGAVSAQTCGEMLDGIASVTGAEIAAAVTGIAGPGGGSAEKPVGLVYTGVRFHGKNTVIENHFSGTRAQIREAACAKIFSMLAEAAENMLGDL